MQPSDVTLLTRVGTEPTDSRPAIDVIFVHGLGGDGTSTWASADGSSWLEWLAEDIPQIAVWSLAYPAGSTKWTTEGEGMALPERATNLIPTLLYHGIGSRGVVFVCHSLGGLVVKQILRHSEEMGYTDWPRLAGSTLGVVFLATPHSGSTLATFAKTLRVPRPTRTVLALRAHCPHLKELGDWYRENAPRLEIETAAYAESRRIRRGIRLFTIVTTTSANPGVTGCATTSIDADHLAISKPTSRESDVYRGIESFLRRQLLRTNSAGATAFIDDHHHRDAALADPPPELVRQIRELEIMKTMHLIDAFELRVVKLGILNRHYGLHDE